MRTSSLFLAAVLVATVALPALPAQTRSAGSTGYRFELPASDDGLPGAGPLRRADWFRRLWNERRSTFADRVEQDRGALVFLGDSITQGWGDDFGGRFSGVKVANRGISGDTTRGVLLRLQEDVIALEPSGVVLLIGTNDIEEQAEPWTIASNIRLIIDALRAADPAMPVVLCEVFPSSASKRRPHGPIRRLNHLIKESVRDQPQVTVIDTWTLFANEQNDASPEEFPDLLHLNDAGYDKWAAALGPVLATFGFVEREPDDFSPEPGFVSLFNGRDLSGWGFRPTSQEDIDAARRWQAGDPNAAAWPIVTESAAFDGLEATPDGRFRAINGRLVVTIPPENRRIQQLWTTKEFGDDFVLRLEFRASPNADSGVYVRGPQLQCRDYPLAGPYKQLMRYREGDWNQLEITVTAGVARATCNGELLVEAMAVPAAGPIGLEGDRGQMEYRRIRIKTTQ